MATTGTAAVAAQVQPLYPRPAPKKGKPKKKVKPSARKGKS